MIRRLIMAAIPFVAVALSAATPAWQAMPPLPQAVGGHALAAAGETLWLVGGSFWTGDMKRIDDTLRRRRLDGGEWETIAHLPHGFAHGGFAADGRALWLAGGLDARGPTAAVTRIELATGVVSAQSPLPEPRAYAGAALLNGALWIVGGTPTETDFTRASAKVVRITIGSTTPHVQIVPAAGPAWINPLVLALRGELHVLPGGAWSAVNQRLEAPSAVWIYSPDTQRWRQRPLATPLPRGLTGVALDGRRALIAGGVEARDGAVMFSARTWIYDAVDGTLTPHTPLPAGRLAAAAVRVGESVWLAGGEDRARSRAATIWRLPLGEKALP